MDPSGFVRWQCGFGGSILVAVAALGHPLTCLLASGSVVLSALVLELFYSRARRDRTLTEGRRAGDASTRQNWGLGLGVPMIVGAVLLGIDRAAYRGYAGLTQGLGIVFGAAFAIVIVSSLIDWYYVLPRLAGEVCLQPCRTSGDPRWKKLTRIWYIHRGIAAIAQALVWLAVIPVILTRWVDTNQIAVVVAVVSAVAVTYVGGLSTTAHMVLHPSFYVGDLVRLIIPGGRVEGYLVDVSVEGVKIKETDLGVYLGKPFGADKHTYKIDSSWLSWIGKSNERFHGCHAGCSGVNWYCRENPAAYAGARARAEAERAGPPT